MGGDRARDRSAQKVFGALIIAEISIYGSEYAGRSDPECAASSYPSPGSRRASSKGLPRFRISTCPVQRDSAIHEGLRALGKGTRLHQAFRSQRDGGCASSCGKKEGGLHRLAPNPPLS